MPSNSSCEEIFPHLQSKPPLCNLGPFHLVLSLVPWEQSPMPSSQGVVESEEVSPKPPLLQAEPPLLQAEPLPQHVPKCPGLGLREDPT